MTLKILPLFQSSLENTEHWMDDVMSELGYDDPAVAFCTLRAVVHALRDRLTPAEAADLASNMPMLIRGIFFEGWRPTALDRPARYRHKQEFLDRVSAVYTRLQEEDVEKTVAGIFRVLSRHIPQGEIADIKNQLPEDVRALWSENEPLAST